MIVVDANVIAYSLIDGEKSGLARNVLTCDPEWRLPPIWRYELSNILWLYVAKGGLKVAASTELLIEALKRLTPYEIEPDQAGAFHMAVTHSITAYDAQYVSLAASLGCPCVTEDRALRGAVPEHAITMREFLNRHPESSGEGISRITEKE